MYRTFAIIAFLISFQSFAQDLIAKVEPLFRSGITITYEYDSLGRQTVQKSKYSTYKFLYSENLVERCYDTLCIKLFLNENGHEEKRVHYNDSTILSISQYNKKGNLIYWKLIDDWGTHSRITERRSVYENGNLVEEIDIVTSNSSIDTTIKETSRKFEHYLDKTNSLDNEAYGTSYLGVSSKNLLKKIVHPNGSEILFEYEYDDKGRIIRQNRSVIGSVSGRESTLFEYLDN